MQDYYDESDFLDLDEDLRESLMYDLESAYGDGLRNCSRCGEDTPQDSLCDCYARDEVDYDEVIEEREIIKIHEKCIKQMMESAISSHYAQQREREKTSPTN